MVENIKQLLHAFWGHITRLDSTWWFTLFCLSVLTGCILIALQRRRNISTSMLLAQYLLIMYIAAVIVLTVLSRQCHGYSLDLLVKHINLDLLGTIASRLSESSGLRTEVLLNSALLLPVGFLLPPATGKGAKVTIAAALTLAVFIELSQLVLARGYFELSDIAENTFGALVGYVICRLINSVCALRAISPTA